MIGQKTRLVAGTLMVSLFASMGFKIYFQKNEIDDLELANKTMAISIAAANIAAYETEKRLNDKVQEAKDEAKKRELALVDAANAARRDVDGLRKSAAKLRDQLDKVSKDAAIDRAVAVADVLGKCAERHQVLAKRCDGHVSDLRTIIDAWPK